MRGSRSWGLLTMLVGCFAATLLSAGPAAADVNCADLPTQGVAQSYFDGRAGDPDRLDGDADGRACESNDPQQQGGWFLVLLAVLMAGGLVRYAVDSDVQSRKRPVRAPVQLVPVQVSTRAEHAPDDASPVPTQKQVVVSQASTGSITELARALRLVPYAGRMSFLEEHARGPGSEPRTCSTPWPTTPPTSSCRAGPSPATTRPGSSARCTATASTGCATTASRRARGRHPLLGLLLVPPAGAHHDLTATTSDPVRPLRPSRPRVLPRDDAPPGWWRRWRRRGTRRPRRRGSRAGRRPGGQRERSDPRGRAGEQRRHHCGGDARADRSHQAVDADGRPGLVRRAPRRGSGSASRRTRSRRRPTRRSEATSSCHGASIRTKRPGSRRPARRRRSSACAWRRWCASARSRPGRTASIIRPPGAIQSPACEHRLAEPVAGDLGHLQQLGYDDRPGPSSRSRSRRRRGWSAAPGAAR